jgi:DNA-binding winged helix-turn-helix (wHTH) protein
VYSGSEERRTKNEEGRTKKEGRRKTVEVTSPAFFVLRSTFFVLLGCCRACVQHFPPFRFDADQQTLWRGPDKIRLTPKASTLLKCLIAGRGAWLSKADIMAAVWPSTHVLPDNIKVLIREIRQALGDSTLFPRFIASSPRRGYAFVAPVSDDVPDARSQGSVASAAGVFVGRSEELAVLSGALRAVRAGTPRMVLVSGDQGLGKTALCDAFVRDARNDGFLRSCLGQCFERDSASEPYSPLLDALVRLDRQHPGLVPASLARYARSWLPYFPQWTGTNVVPKAPEAILDELASALAAMSRDVPLVLVVEDLQWADTATLHALSHLAAFPRAQLLIVGTYCDGEWVASRRAKQRVTAPHPRTSLVSLRALTIDQVRRYVDARFGPTHVSDIAAAVHKASGGNPYMIRIALDRVVARGLVSMGSGGWRREAAQETIARALPESLGEAVAEHLDHLDPRERELLEAAAVIGREFSSAQVAFALGTKHDDARQLLAAMARRGQIIVAASPESSPRAAAAAYRFRLALYADVIAQHAPMIRQLHTIERLGARRAGERRRA